MCRGYYEHEELEAPELQKYVYFIQEGDDGPVKIGSAYSPAYRLGTLQTGNPRRLHIRGTLRGGVGLERRMQAGFRAYQLEGEWFSPELPVLAAIRSDRPDLEDRRALHLDRRCEVCSVLLGVEEIGMCAACAYERRYGRTPRNVLAE